MKYSKSIISLVLTLLFVWASLGQAQTREINWNAFSKNLVIAIKSGNPGLQQSAMQHIIQYADNLNVKDAVWDLSRIMRFNDNCRVRRLAMVTLYKINTDKALGYLTQNLKFEKDQGVKKQGCCILSEFYAAKKVEQAYKTAITAK